MTFRDTESIQPMTLSAAIAYSLSLPPTLVIIKPGVKAGKVRGEQTKNRFEVKCEGCMKMYRNRNALYAHSKICKGLK
jgi:hypothetical protein